MHDASSCAELRLKKQHARLKPELRRLVMMCDLLAVSLRARQHRDAPRLLNELCDSIAGVPSELDIRAAAVRVFANDAAAMRWLRPPRDADNEASATETTTVADPVSADGIRGICLQYQRAQREMGRFYDLCEHLFRKSKKTPRRSREKKTEQDFDELLLNATGLSIEDVQAAATRLGLETQNSAIEQPQSISPELFGAESITVTSGAV